MDLKDKIDDYLEDNEEYNEYEELSEALLDFISTLDLDNLNDEQIEYLDDVFTLMEEDELFNDRVCPILNERFIRKVRGKKIVRKKVCRPGYKAVDGSCKKIKQSEKRKRGKGAKRASRKKKGKKMAINRARKKSMKVRKRANL